MAAQARSRQAGGGVDRVMLPLNIVSLMSAAGWPDREIPTGVAVALAESGGHTHPADNHNSNGTVDCGLWQINSVHAKSFPTLWPARYHPYANTLMAKKIYDSAHGWTPWSTYQSGAYRAHLMTSDELLHAHGSMSTGQQIKSIAGLTADAVVSPIKSVYEAVTGLLSWLADPHNWLRIVEIAAGGAALLIGAYLLARSGAAGDTVKQAAGDAASAAKLAAIA